MRETGKIDAAAHDAAAVVPVFGRIHGPEIELEAPNLAEMVRIEMVRLHGEVALTEGFRVTTTVDSRLQSAANAAVRRGMLDYERRHGYRGPLEQLEAAQLGDPAVVAAAFKRHADRGGLSCALVESVLEGSALLKLRTGVAVEVGWDDLSWARPALQDGALGPAPKVAADVITPGQLVYLETVEDGRYRLAQLPAVAAALVAIEPRDGAIVSLVGGFDFGSSKYNRAIQARRQPGSAFKPFVYSAALERGFTPASLINDAPIVIPGGVGTEEWRPQNITKRFYGPTPMREALVRSRNLVSIRLLRATGVGPALRHIGAFGFGPDALPPNLTLALGTGQVTPLEMVRGFAVFANGGFRVEPYFIARVADHEDRTVFTAEPRDRLRGLPGHERRPAGNHAGERLRDDRHHDGRDPAGHGSASQDARAQRPRRQDRHDQ